VTDTLVHAKARSGHGRWAISRRWRRRRWRGSTGSGAAGPDGRRPSRPSSFEPRTFAA